MCRRLPNTLPISSKFYVGRRFIKVTRKSHIWVLTFIFISTIFFTVRISIANQRFADALTWPQKRPSHKNKRGKKGNYMKSKGFAPSPQHYTHILMWVWHKSSVCWGKDWWLFWSLFCNTQNWFWPWQDTKLKIEPESQFQAFSRKHQAVCLNPPKSYNANHGGQTDLLHSIFGFSSVITDSDAKVLLFFMT